MANVNFTILEDPRASTDDLVEFYSQIKDILENEILPERSRLKEKILSQDRAKMGGGSVNETEYKKLQNDLSEVDRRFEVCSDGLEKLRLLIPERQAEEASAEIKILNKSRKILIPEAERAFFKEHSEICGIYSVSSILSGT